MKRLYEQSPTIEVKLFFEDVLTSSVAGDDNVGGWKLTWFEGTGGNGND